VHLPANPVANILANDGISMRLSVLLNDVSDITDVISNATMVDRQLQRLFGDAYQFQEVIANPTDRNRGRGVTHKPVERRTHID
jgi:hypothetical protein